MTIISPAAIADNKFAPTPMQQHVLDAVAALGAGAHFKPIQQHVEQATGHTVPAGTIYGAIYELLDWQKLGSSRVNIGGALHFVYALS